MQKKGKDNKRIIDAFKENVPKEEEDKIMTIAESLRLEGRQEGRMEGEVEGKKEVALSMLRKNCEINFIIEVTGLAKEDVLRLKEKLATTHN